MAYGYAYTTPAINTAQNISQAMTGATTPSTAYLYGSVLDGGIITIGAIALFVLAWVIAKPSHKEWMWAIITSALFIFFDYFYHLIPSLEVIQPMYSIDKLVYSIPLLIIAYRFLKTHLFTAIAVSVALETRYFSLYEGRVAYGISFNILLIVAHTLILWYILWAQDQKYLPSGN